ncbi:MAG: hypothetical protein JWN52_7965, partial [Actinomycetia bacterium]|nr:hypothetical protein [Actinomycetes bacterium]
MLDVTTTPVSAAVHPGDKVSVFVVVHASNAIARNG